MTLRRHEDVPQLEELSNAYDAVLAVRAAVDERLKKVHEAQVGMRLNSSMPLDPSRDAEWAESQLGSQVGLIFDRCALQEEIKSLVDLNDRLAQRAMETLDIAEFFAGHELAALRADSAYSTSMEGARLADMLRERVSSELDELRKKALDSAGLFAVPLFYRCSDPDPRDYGCRFSVDDQEWQYVSPLQWLQWKCTPARWPCLTRADALAKMDELRMILRQRSHGRVNRLEVFDIRRQQPVVRITVFRAA